MNQADLAGGFRCRTCGEYHEGPPLSYGFEAPAAWYDVPEEELEQRTKLVKNTCIVDDQYFFILGNIPLPIVGSDEEFQWTVWVSLSEKNFARAIELWEQPGRESEPPYFGWLSTSIPTYPDTLNLKTLVHTQPVGDRPIIELEPTDHPLAVEQREGITWERVREIAEFVLHEGA